MKMFIEKKPVKLCFFALICFLMVIGIIFGISKDKFNLRTDKAKAIDNTYYVATDGINTTARNGSTDAPWKTVEYALSQVGGGKTILVKPGIYSHFEISVNYKGTEAAPTIIKSEVKWKASIIGSAIHGIYTGDGCEWVIIDGFEVMGARYDGIKTSGDHNTIRNNWVHNNVQQGVSTHSHTGEVIENNLIEFNGTHIQFHHGIYASGDGLIIRNNVVRHNAGSGLHLYPSIENSVITNNLMYGHDLHSGIIVDCPTGGGNNIIANNTIANNKTGLTIWNGNGEIVANNIFSGNTTQVSVDNTTTNTIATNNLLYSPTTSVLPNINTVIGDPKFVESPRGAYWLKADSAAIGVGSATYLPTTDFWGHAQPALPYIGAFPYTATFIDDTYRTDQWYLRWVYGYPPLETLVKIPDYWNY